MELMGKENTAEVIERIAKDDRTREILLILNECETLEEAKEKVKALLTK